MRQQSVIYRQEQFKAHKTDLMIKSINSVILNQTFAKH